MCNACAIYGYREEESPCAIVVQIRGHREEATCAIYGYHEEESPCAILVQICGHREEAPCEIVVQSKDIMKRNHLVQSVNIMKNYHQFARFCICDAEFGISCKEELLESW